MIPRMIGFEIKDHAKNFPNAPRIYHKGNISKMPDFDGFFLFWNVKNVKVDSW